MKLIYTIGIAAFIGSLFSCTGSVESSSQIAAASLLKKDNNEEFMVVQASLKDSLKRAKYCVDSNGIAIGGLDPVSYHIGKPEKGKPELSYQVDGVRYFFISKENMEEFKKTPLKYIPAFGGWCALAMSQGSKCQPDYSVYNIYQDKLYLFESEYGLKVWSKNLEENRKKANKNYGQLIISRQ